MNLDKRRVGHQFNKSAHLYDGLSGMQREIVDALLAKVCFEQAFGGESDFPTICDLGCGTGYALSKIAGKTPSSHLIGLDLAPAMLDIATDRLLGVGARSIEMMEGDIESLPIEAESVDLCFSSSALQWCDNSAAFAEIYRVLKPGGLAVVSSFTSGTLDDWRSLWGGRNDQRFLSEREFSDAASSTGLFVESLTAEQKVQSFYSFEAALASVRDLGAGNAGQSREKGLMGASHFRHVVQQVNELIARNGHISLIYNVVYLVARKG